MQNITFPVNAELQAQAVAAGFGSVEEYLTDLVAQDADRLAIMEGYNDFKAGRYKSAEKFDADIRRDFGLPPRQ